MAGQSAGKEGKTFFSRVVDDSREDIDIKVIIAALRMLFHGDNFKIIIETYGE